MPQRHRGRRGLVGFLARPDVCARPEDLQSPKRKLCGSVAKNSVALWLKLVAPWLTLGIASVRLDLADLQDVPLRVRRDHQEPLIDVHVAVEQLARSAGRPWSSSRSRSSSRAACGTRRATALTSANWPCGTRASPVRARLVRSMPYQRMPRVGRLQLLGGRRLLHRVLHPLPVLRLGDRQVLDDVGDRPALGRHLEGELRLRQAGPVRSPASFPSCPGAPAAAGVLLA